MNGDDVEEMLYGWQREPRGRTITMRERQFNVTKAKDAFASAALELYESMTDTNGLYDHFEVQSEFKKAGRVYVRALEALRK